MTEAHKETFPELRPWNRRWPVLLMGLAVFFSFFVNLGNAPLFDRDEGAFSEATREMVESGNYVSTTLNEEPRYDKPILTYYIQAVGVALLGWNEWGLGVQGDGDEGPVGLTGFCSLDE
jgi:4-amino-4-deoxy-L-arabinose transferase-like glycosyltransferase